MKQNRNEESGGPENDTVHRFHIEDSPATQGNSGTSGQVGPKSKRRFSAANGPPVPDTPDASPPVREDSSMSGIGATAKPKQRFSVTNGPPIPEKPDAPASARDSSGTSGQVGPKFNRHFPPSESPPILNAPDAPPPTPLGRSKYRPHSEQARFSDRLRHEEEPPPGGNGGPTSDGGGASSDKKAARDGRRFGAKNPSSGLKRPVRSWTPPKKSGEAEAAKNPDPVKNIRQKGRGWRVVLRPSENP